jgi:hypothetical protein
MGGEVKKDIRKEVAIDGYIDYLRRLKDVSDCPTVDLEKAKKSLQDK